MVCPNQSHSSCSTRMSIQDTKETMLPRLCTKWQKFVPRLRVVVHCPHAPGLPMMETMDGVEIRRFRYAREDKQTLAYRGDMHKQVKRSISKAMLFFSFLRKWKKASQKTHQRIEPHHRPRTLVDPGAYVTKKAMKKRGVCTYPCMGPMCFSSRK